ncbi:MAG TPA: DUF6230 family protein [Streptosporangiaceae bacterium]|jgi:hypothetical protein|nr:DUF6230 family protein [Streptosporangiaceae bacterium]
MPPSETTPAEPPSRATGRVRWKRFAVLFLPAMVAAGTLVGLTAEGVLAASISVSGSAFEVSSTQLQGTGFEQFGGVVQEKNGVKHLVAISAIGHATLANLCQSVSVPGTSLTMRLTAGSGGTPASATNLIVDADHLAGNATFHNITIGQDASTLTEVPGVGGQPGSFGQQATAVTIDNLRQHTWLTTAGTFKLPGLSLGFGSKCY